MKGPRIVVTKHKNLLELFDGDSLVISCKAVTGVVPSPKKRRGDKATPEGDYAICSKTPDTPAGPALLISYPGRMDAKRGFYAGVITRDQQKAILDAHEKGAPPPPDTELGGSVSILGAEILPGGTEGSIAIPMAEMRALFEAAAVGTTVCIKA